MLKLFKHIYFRFSRNILKAYFGVETPIYKRWRAKRAVRIQYMLDHQNKNNTTNMTNLSGNESHESPMISVTLVPTKSI